MAIFSEGGGGPGAEPELKFLSCCAGKVRGFFFLSCGVKGQSRSCGVGKVRGRSVGGVGKCVEGVGSVGGDVGVWGEVRNSVGGGV